MLIKHIWSNIHKCHYILAKLTSLLSYFNIPWFFVLHIIFLSEKELQFLSQSIPRMSVSFTFLKYFLVEHYFYFLSWIVHEYLEAITYNGRLPKIRQFLLLLRGGQLVHFYHYLDHKIPPPQQTCHMVQPTRWLVQPPWQLSVHFKEFLNIFLRALSFSRVLVLKQLSILYPEIKKILFLNV